MNAVISLRNCALLAFITFSQSLHALTYSEITKLPNPYLESDKNISDLNSDEAIQYEAAKERFHMCQYGVIEAVGNSRRRVTLEKYEKRGEVYWKKKWAGNHDLEYPFDMSVVESDGDATVTKHMVEMAWANPVSSDADAEVLANKFWKSCLLLPIKAFVGDSDDDE